MADTPLKKKQLRPLVNAAVHPLVLLSVVDHHVRMDIKRNNRRVVGVLLGKIRKDGVAEVTNAFAVPFDEDNKTGVYYLDHSFVEQMFGMFKRVNASEVILGWYHSFGEMRNNDIVIHQSFRKYTDNPLLLIVNVLAHTHELPVKAYLSHKTVSVHSVEEVDTFSNLDVTLVASPPEEVGVEHVLRDVQNQEHIPTLTEELRSKKIGLGVLKDRATMIRSYLEDVKAGKLDLNQDILYLLQDIFNLMPDISQPQLKSSIIKVTNDQSLSVYTASIVRTILSLDALITNRKENKQRRDAKLEKQQDEKVSAKETKVEAKENTEAGEKAQES